ncbi:GNAT family N-acetyltransferase [Paenibacillus sp. MZ04-78.2]|uniref:GNAT family N-acetyltransferase n=1 Tax=Paenibacillus sp. MZ04-78.2 TaxID=2962034 RepID=UPI0020B86E02|nr:GNAT family N-acetyltransferase [Paenibacillus sp. MZ04-78.2]MCP3772956.1 GNAT family N-acetyltransferase [Paenibacillus sp. MZ04-78.2]
MIVELDVNEYSKITPLLSEKDKANVTLMSIVAGSNKGKIFVDARDRPRTAMVWAIASIAFFVGDCRNSEFTTHLNSYMDQKIKQDSLDIIGGTWFTAAVADEAWDEAVNEALTDYELVEGEDLQFEFAADRYSKLRQAQSESRIQITPLDVDLLHDPANDFVLEDLSEFWNSTGDFMDKGFGYCVLKDKTVQSVCFSGYVYGNGHDLVVRTYEEEERQKGLGAAVTFAYLDHCVRNGLVPHWTTDEENEASIALANKCGFVLKEKSKVYEFEF